MRSFYNPTLLLLLTLAAPLEVAAQPHGGGARQHDRGETMSAGRESERAPRGMEFAASGGWTDRQREAFPSSNAPRRGEWLRNNMQLPPNEQQHRLEQDQQFRQLPPQRQQELRNRLQRFNTLPETQKQRVVNHMEMLDRLPPERRTQTRELLGRFSALPAARKEAVRRTLRQLRTMPPAARQRLLNSPEVQRRFSPQEQQMLRGFDALGLGSD